ncbi:MAG TPA: hypothetical protein ENG18_01435, partial [Nitrososphaeria archaeon]|nr:hypothetical protein [Nitrososphaeria archaeon]
MDQPEPNFLKEFLSTISREILYLTPKLLIAILMIVAAFIIVRFVGSGVRKLLSMADVDGMI